MVPTCIESEQDQGQRLMLFSDVSAMQAAEAAKLISAGGPSFKISPAEHHQLLAKLSGLWVNPGSPQALKIEEEDFKTYQDLVKGLAVERCLAGLNESPDFNGILRKYKAWWIILVDGQSKLMLLPDEQGRQFAAVFSAWDGVEAAVSKLVSETEYKNPAAIPMTGTELFTQMQKLDVEGMIFNCAGPVQSHSFSKELANEIMEEA